VREETPGRRVLAPASPDSAPAYHPAQGADTPTERAPLLRRRRLSDAELCRLLEVDLMAPEPPVIELPVMPLSVSSTPETPVTTRPGADPARWKVWREAGDGKTTVLYVCGSVSVAPGNAGCRIVLQEAVIASPGDKQWGNSGGAANSSPILVLERLTIPPAFGDFEPGKSNESGPVHVPIAFTKTERLAPGQHTHVTILPDNVTLRISSI